MADNNKHRSPGTRQKTLVGAVLSAGMLAAAGAVVFFSWMTEEVFEGESLAIDNAVRDFVHVYATGWLTAVMQVFSFLGSTLFLIPVVILCVAVFLFKHRRRPALIMAVVMAGAVILNYVLKVSFARVRPDAYFDTPLPASFSFPSGHALFSVCFYGTLAWIIASRVEGRVYKVAIWTAALALAFFIGLSRIYLGVHYPTDVLAGYTAAFIWVSMVIWADSVLDKTKA